MQLILMGHLQQQIYCPPNDDTNYKVFERVLDIERMMKDEFIYE